MSKRLWDKGGVTDSEMLRYTARDDWRLDQRLLPFDLQATAAHVHGLGRIGVLEADEVAALERAIDALDQQWRSGQLQLGEQDEDGHSAIEAALVAELGELGQKVHTGRSRNDQVLVALRLYERQALDDIMAAARVAGSALLELAEREADTPMVGYTHLQRAVPSSVGLWAASFADSFADALGSLASARAQTNRCPLGAAAGYGVNLPLDRQGVARELGFAAAAINPLASQSSRGVIEVVVLSACWQLMASVRRLAWDLSLFGMSEIGFMRLDDALTTGSSIMPNKRNPDIAELMRAACAVVEGAMGELFGVLSLPSGYHRDLQLTKAPLMRALDETLQTIRLLPRLVAGLHLYPERMRSALSPECFATDRAIELSASGLPFRQAYQQVARELGQLEAGDPEASLRARVSPGAPGALQLEALRARLDSLAPNSDEPTR